MSINMTQAFEFETDDLDSMRKMLETIVPILFDKDSGIHTKIHLSDSNQHLFNDGAKYEENENGRWERKNPTRVWVTTMSDYEGDVQADDFLFPDRQGAINKIIDMLEKCKLEDIVGKIGDGYDSCFNHSDGDIGLGYRIHWEPSGGWNLLHVSLVHAYYGK